MNFKTTFLRIVCLGLLCVVALNVAKAHAQVSSIDIQTDSSGSSESELMGTFSGNVDVKYQSQTSNSKSRVDINAHGLNGGRVKADIVNKFVRGSRNDSQYVLSATGANARANYEELTAGDQSVFNRKVRMASLGNANSDFRQTHLIRQSSLNQEIDGKAYGIGGDASIFMDNIVKGRRIEIDQKAALGSTGLGGGKSSVNYRRIIDVDFKNQVDRHRLNSTATAGASDSIDVLVKKMDAILTEASK